jgi:hypothetical protein
MQDILIGTTLQILINFCVFDVDISRVVRLVKIGSDITLWGLVQLSPRGSRWESVVPRCRSFRSELHSWRRGLALSRRTLALFQVVGPQVQQSSELNSSLSAQFGRAIPNVRCADVYFLQCVNVLEERCLCRETGINLVPPSKHVECLLTRRGVVSSLLSSYFEIDSPGPIPRGHA